MRSTRPRRTASGGRWWWAAPILTLLLVLSAMPALVSAQGETAEFEGRIEARRLSSGRVEFGFRPEGEGRILPERRFFPADAHTGRWLVSSDVASDGEVLGRITARLLDDGRIEFGFSDGVDGELDRNGWIAERLNVALTWITAQTGRRLRVDTFNGEPDVTFVRHELTEEEFRQCNGVVCYVDLDEEYFGIGSLENKVYLIFFGHSIDDPNSSHNRSASADIGGPDRPGWSARFGVNVNDSLDNSSSSTWALRLLPHEILHILGAVPDGAPHPEAGHHVCDGRPDIMSYCEPGLAIDPGRDDYYGHDLDGVWDIEDSPLWVDPPQKD